jgi:hypothetical protein
MGMNQLHEVGCALYIRHRYNQVVVDNFVGDEFIGAERKQPLKDRVKTSVKEVHKLPARSEAAVGLAGGPFTGKAKKRDGRGGWKQPVAKGSLPPGFDKPKTAVGEQPCGKAQVQCYKYLEKGHFAKDCPNK